MCFPASNNPHARSSNGAGPAFGDLVTISHSVIAITRCWPMSRACRIFGDRKPQHISSLAKIMRAARDFSPDSGVTSA